MKNSWRTSILIIEDNEIDAALITERLNGKGLYKISLANSLENALGHLSHNGKLDAILLDLTLPDSNGLDTFNSIHKKAPHIPIVILTGIDDDAIVLSTLQNGAQDYLIKGQVNNQLLERTIRYAIERKQFEEDLIKSKAQLDEAMELAGLYQWEYDISEGCFLFNEKLWEFFGNPNSASGIYKLSLEEFLNNYVEATDRQIFEDEIKKARETAEPGYASQLEFRIADRSGAIKHLIGRIRVRIGEDSMPVGFFGIIQDITERKIALLKSYEALNQVDSAKTEFLYFISHEIRTPLNGVVSAVNLIKNQENSSVVRTMVETLDRSVSNLESFTNNAILYTKLTNNYTLEPSQFKLKELIQFALFEKENALREKDIKVNLVAGSDSILFNGDKDLTYKLFLNAIEVFVCNSSQQGKISIELGDTDDNIICSIFDADNSFPANLVKSYASVTGIYQNSQMGLNLYIIKLIVDKHRGELEIFNKSGCAATARFIFPK